VFPEIEIGSRPSGLFWVLLLRVIVQGVLGIEAKVAGQRGSGAAGQRGSGAAGQRGSGATEKRRSGAVGKRRNDK
jgi:hypothetical protein